MAELKCDATNCGYNKEKCCCRGDITVGGKCACTTEQTCCESFRDRKTDSFINSLNEPCKTISIDCEAANCVHNKEYKCYAEHINIIGQGACECHATACETFKER